MNDLAVRASGVLAVAVALAAPALPYAVQGPDDAAGPASTLDRVTGYVERYYGRAQSVMADEVVTLQHLQTDLSPSGFPRRLVYELRVEWTPATATEEAKANVVRQLMRVGSRPAKPGEEPDCLDPRGVSPEPLAFLLADRRSRFRFSGMGRARLDARDALLLDYTPSLEEAPTASGTRTCISLDMPGRTRGRIWVDPDTAAVLRLDEFLVGPTDVPIPRRLQSVSGWGLRVSVDRADTTTRYEAVSFSDPEETLMLPSRIDSVSVIRANGVQRLRLTQEFRNYRRFLTDSRIVQ